MAIISGWVPFSGFVSPTDSTDTYAVTDPLYGKGSLRTVADTTERDAITAARKDEWMLVYVKADWKYYKLWSDLTTWTEFTSWWGWSSVWWSITWTLSDQTDLQTELSDKWSKTFSVIDNTTSPNTITASWWYALNWGWSAPDRPDGTTSFCIMQHIQYASTSYQIAHYVDWRIYKRLYTGSAWWDWRRIDVPAVWANGTFLTSNGTVASWASPKEVINLWDLADVTTTTPSNGQAIVYDTATSKWINATVATGTWSTELPSYSTNEVLTSERWTDGRPVYKRTIDCGYLPNTTTKYVAIPSFASSNVYWIDPQNSFARDPAAWWSVPIPKVSTTTNYVEVALKLSTGEILIATPNNQSSLATYVTIKYVKGTDTASSPVQLVGWVNGSSQLPAFSTNEVLTAERWTDGKPIYKKTINFWALPNNTTKSVAHGVTWMWNFWLDFSSSYTSSPDGVSAYAPNHNNTVTIANQWYAVLNTTNVVMATGADRSTYSAIITIKYTKTSDTSSSPVALVGSVENITTGVEYIVHQIIDGKQVYGKRVNFWSLPNTTTKSVAHGISWATDIWIWSNSRVLTSAGDRQCVNFPHTSAASSNFNASVWTTNINMTAWTDRSTSTAIFEILYTK